MPPLVPGSTGTWVFSASARDLLDGMLQKTPELRLGSAEADSAEIKSHAWFAVPSLFDFDAMQVRCLGLVLHEPGEGQPAALLEIDAAEGGSGCCALL